MIYSSQKTGMGEVAERGGLKLQSEFWKFFKFPKRKICVLLKMQRGRAGFKMQRK